MNDPLRDFPNVPIVRPKGRRTLTLDIAMLAGITLDLMREPALIAHREILVKDALPMEFEIERMELDAEAGKVLITLVSPSWPAGDDDGAALRPQLAIRTEPVQAFRVMRG